MWRVLFLFASACSFSARSAEQPPAGDAPPAIDGLSDACTPNATACDGRVRKVCGGDGHWNPTLDTVCDFTCSQGACVVASNVPLPDIKACTAAAPALAPPAGATVTISASGGTVHLDCTPDCGNSVVRIDPVATLASSQPSLSWFCLSSIDLPAGAQLVASAASPTPNAIAFVVDGAVSIAGTVSLDGGSATRSTTGGRGAPGGFAGSDLTSSANANGHGPCAGNGGGHDGPNFGDHWIGGGGGGGGNGTAGALGGGGRCTSGDHTAGGGGASGTCGMPGLVPLVGGSGGGAGGDATVNVQQGWAGGGGGGALQISSRVSISITGTLGARGGNGYGEMSVDGGGGGGAGGALLLEAPSLMLSGMLVVDGGAGGSAGAGPGGTGATGSSPAMTGVTFTQNGQGGSGGGGGAGRIRLNAGNPACPATASPAGACTTGPLTLQ